MLIEDNKKIAEILHTIFCERNHEQNMLKIDTTQNCVYYLEQSIDRTWELSSHMEWFRQAQFLSKISEPLDILEVIQDMVKIYQIAEQFKKVNPKLLEFIKILIT